MKFLSHDSKLDSQWQTYKQLELLPESITRSNRTNARFMFGLSWAWESLIKLLVAELIAEKRADEYLDRCWALDGFDTKSSPTSHLKQLWVLMD